MEAIQIIMIMQLSIFSTIVITGLCFFIYDRILWIRLKIKEKRDLIFLKKSGVEQFNALLDQNARLKQILNGELEERN